MAISPVSISRVTQNLRTDFITGSLQKNQVDLFNSLMRLSSGRNFATPSEDPAAAARSLDLKQALERQAQYSENVQHADNVLSATDSAIAEISSLLIESSTIASQNLSNLTSADERYAEAELIAGIRGQLVSVGNRQFNGRYIFGGRDTLETPFVDALGGIAYLGDTGEMIANADVGVDVQVNVPGNQLYGALSGQITSNANLRPALTSSTRLDSLEGGKGEGIRLGTLVFNETGGAGYFKADLTGADTVGDVVDRINAAATAAGSGLVASISNNGLTITPNGEVTISDTSTGIIAADLGIISVRPVSEEFQGNDLRVRVTPLTAVSDLAGGAGIDIDSGMVITNGQQSSVIDLSNAKTVQDVVNKINNAGVFVLARISEDGSRIDLLNQVSGTSLTVGENGGTTAADLGARTLDTSTKLSELNFGDGLVLAEGLADLSITAKDGQSFEVDLDSATTVGDVISLINTAATDAGVSVVASFATVGNGIRITDGSGGTGDLIVASANLSQAAMDLGIEKTARGEVVEIVGDDVNPTRTDGFLDALLQLETALRHDDTQGIAAAAARIEDLQEDVRRTHGIVGARSQAAKSKLDQMQDASYAAESLLSEVEDLDYADAVTRMQATQTQLQAGMQVSTQLLNLSLLDYLG